MSQVPYIFLATVISVVDGDTCDVNISLGFNIYTVQRLRIADYDAPETYRPRNQKEREHGKRATEFAKGLLSGQQVTIKTFKTGKYGRYIAEIELAEPYNGLTNYRDIMVANGFEKKEEY